MVLHEPGEQLVRNVIVGALLSSVNFAEICSKLLDKGMTEALDRLDESGVEIVDFTHAQAVMVGRLRAATRGAGLSLGDRACLALAQETGRTALTADAAWARVPGLDVRLIR